MARSKEYELAIKIAGEVEKSFTNSMGVTRKELRSIASAAASSATGTKANFQSGLKDVEDLFQGTQKYAKRAFRAIVTAAETAGAGIAAGLGASIKVGSGFEQQMSTVKAISQANDEEFASLTETAKGLGATTKFTAQEVGEAMEYMAMAGWKAEDINSGISGVMDLAAASGENLGTVSDIVTDAMTAFGLSADQVGHFSDVLAQASANANTNVAMMGETFKYAAPVAGAMGYSIEDVALAVGMMANSGVKASQAGTALRRIITNLASPTDEVASAMKLLGVSLVADDGKAKSLYEVMLDMREGMSGLIQPTDEQISMLQALGDQYEAGQLTEEEFTAKQNDLIETIYGAEGAMKAAAAASLAGRYGMAGMLAITNASEEDFEALRQSIENCSGAAEEMANVKLDNLAGDVTIMKSAMDGLGIEVYDQIKDPLRDAAQAGTEFITSITEDLAESGALQAFITNLSEKIPTLISDVKDLAAGLVDFASPVLSVGGWLVEHPGVIEGMLAGVGGAIVTYKLTSTLGKVAGGFTKLATVLTNPWALAILGVSAAAGVLFGVIAGVEAKNAADRAKDLAEHFGSIQLNLKDLKLAADAIVDNGSLGALNEAITAFESSESTIATMDSAVQTLNKANWKVSMGMELTQKEMSEYQSTIEGWVEACQQVVTDQAYGVNVSLSLVSDGLNPEENYEDALASSAVRKVTEFYQGKQQELAALGKELNEYVTTAFNDGLLDIDEAQHIQELQQQMANIQAALATSGYEAALERIGMGYSGANLTPESFQNLQAEIANSVAAARASFDEALEHNIAALNVAYRDEGSTMTEAEYNAAMSRIKEDYLNNLAEIELQAQRFSMTTIMDAYGEKIKAAMPDFATAFDEAMAGIAKNPDNVTRMTEYLGQVANSSTLEKEVQANIAELLKNMEPTTESLQTLADKYRDYGISVPENISQGLKDVETLKALTGDIEAVYLVAVDELTNSEALTEMINACTEEGVGVPDTFQKAILDHKDDVKPAIDAVHQTTGDYLREVFANGYDISTTIRMHAEPEITGVNVPAQYTSRAGKGRADGGIVTSPELSWIAEAGYPESVIPWDGSRNAFDLWMQTGSGIGAFDKLSGSGIIGDLLDGMEHGSSQDNSMVITYSPQLNFYGGTPSKDDIVDAGRMSQQEFDKMMAAYMRNQRRLSFAGG